MRAKEILSHLRKQPFQPIRIYISDGASYAVRHPEMMAVSNTAVFIALPPMRGGVPDNNVHCDPVHITRIEPLNGAKPKRSKSTKKS